MLENSLKERAGQVVLCARTLVVDTDALVINQIPFGFVWTMSYELMTHSQITDHKVTCLFIAAGHSGGVWFGLVLSKQPAAHDWVKRNGT